MFNDPKLKAEICTHTLSQLAVRIAAASYMNTDPRNNSFDSALGNTLSTMKITMLWLSANVSPIPESVINSLFEDNFDD